MKIFLSSTYADLVDYREDVLDVLIRYEAIFKGMEFFGASEHNALTLCLEQLDQCDLVICLLGTRYGTKPPGSEKSYTHHEIDRAIELNLPVLIYILDEERQPVYRKYIDQGDDEKALLSLKNSLMSKFTVERFTTPENLGKKIATGLATRFSGGERTYTAKDKLQERGFFDEAIACYRDAHKFFSQRNILYGLSIVSTALVKLR